MNDGSKSLLNSRWEAFAQAYVKDTPGSLARSYAFAGYKVRTTEIASAGACWLLKNEKVSVRIAWLQSQGAAKAAMSREEWLQKLVDIVKNGSRTSDQLRALELIGKSCGFFEPDRLDVTHHFPDFFTGDPQRFVDAAKQSKAIENK